MGRTLNRLEGSVSKREKTFRMKIIDALTYLMLGNPVFGAEWRLEFKFDMFSFRYSFSIATQRSWAMYKEVGGNGRTEDTMVFAMFGRYCPP